MRRNSFLGKRLWTLTSYGNLWNENWQHSSACYGMLYKSECLEVTRGKLFWLNICLGFSKMSLKWHVTSVTTLWMSDVICFPYFYPFPQATMWYAVATTVVWLGSIWTCPPNHTKFSGESARAGFYNLGSLGQTRGKLLVMLGLSNEWMSPSGTWSGSV